MNLIGESLNLPTIIFGWLIFVLSLIWVFKTAPWYKLHDKHAQNVMLGASLLVFFIWQFSASIDEGLHFHFLLMTLLTMMFAPQFAVLAMTLALLGVTLVTDLGVLALGINAFVMGLVPIFITWFMYKIGARFLEANFFVYVFYNGFFSAAIGVVVSLLMAAVVLLINDIYSYEQLKQLFIPYIPLMATPEGFVNAMALAALVILKPNWVSTFHDKNYFQGK